MSINLTHPELLETASRELPVASLETLKTLREEMCSQSGTRDFKLQSHQRFLRRILSPDSSTRSLLMVHGTGTGKTCSAIQIAEEYILRPEFQDQRVLVLAQPAVQENFKNQIFDITRVFVDDQGLLLSKQCTGRRYLDILERIQHEPMKWSDPAVRSRMDTTAKKIISVADTAPDVIKSQAITFQNHVEQVVLHYMKCVIACDRSTVSYMVTEAGHPQLAELIRRP